MKISEFAKLNNVTTKMLRHYDEIRLFKPASIDSVTGYRSYNENQCQYLNWIVILKNLDFSLVQIKDMLNGPVDVDKLIHELKWKRIEISSTMNEQIQKKLQIDKLIKVIEKEGFKMDKRINLLSIENESVHEIKKNMPNMEMFLEAVQNIVDLCTGIDNVSVIRFDLWHFKQVNDDFGYDVGDSVIVTCYNIIKSNVEKFKNSAAIGRAHGDEFIVFAKADKEEIEKIMGNIVRDMDNFDFSILGCKKQMGCYIGGVIGALNTELNLRKMIHESIEAIDEARKIGRNAIVIQAYVCR